jgi:ribonuclease D
MRPKQNFRCPFAENPVPALMGTKSPVAITSPRKTIAKRCLSGYYFKVEIFVARTVSEIDAAYERLASVDAIGCDTETSGLSARRSRLFSIQFSDGEFSCLVPVSEGVPPGKLESILANPKITKIFHNARFDLEFLRENGVAVNNVFCTMIAERLLTKGAKQSASLAETLYRHFAVDLDKSPRSKFTRKWNGIWTEELVHYALADVVYLPRLMREQRLWMETLGLADDYAKQLERSFRDDLQV